MAVRNGMWLVVGVAGFLSALYAQKPWREYPAFEYNDFPIPPDYQEKTEWVFARLMYPNAAFDRGGYAYHGRIAALADAAREGGLEF